MSAVHNTADLPVGQSAAAAPPADAPAAPAPAPADPPAPQAGSSAEPPAPEAQSNAAAADPPKAEEPKPEPAKKTHKAAIYDNPGTISTKVVDVETPEPGPGEVLVQL
jgi:hypothetical protein